MGSPLYLRMNLGSVDISEYFIFKKLYTKSFHTQMWDSINLFGHSLGSLDLVL